MNKSEKKIVIVAGANVFLYSLISVIDDNVWDKVHAEVITTFSLWLMFSSVAIIFFGPYVMALIAILKNAWKSYKSQSLEPTKELRNNDTKPNFRNTKPNIKYKKND